MIITGLGNHLFVKLLRPENSERKDSEGPFRSSSQADTCYYQSNHLKVEAIPLSAFVQGTKSELSSLASRSHYPLLCWTSSRDVNRGRRAYKKFYCVSVNCATKINTQAQIFSKI